MTFDELRQNLESEFNTQWGTTTPIAWQNAGGEPQENNITWVRFTIVPRRSRNVVIGSDVPRLIGDIVVQIFVPLDEGLGDGWRLADTVNSALQNKNISGILTYASHVDSIGEGVRRVKDVEQGYHQFNVKIPYEVQ